MSSCVKLPISSKFVCVPAERSLKLHDAGSCGAQNSLHADDSKSWLWVKTVILYLFYFIAYSFTKRENICHLFSFSSTAPSPFLSFSMVFSWFVWDIQALSYTHLSPKVPEMPTPFISTRMHWVLNSSRCRASPHKVGEKGHPLPQGTEEGVDSANCWWRKSPVSPPGELIHPADQRSPVSDNCLKAKAALLCVS